MFLTADCMEYEKKIKKSLVRELMALPESAPLSERRACLHEDFSSLSTNVLQDDPSNPLIRSTVVSNVVNLLHFAAGSIVRHQAKYG